MIQMARETPHLPVNDDPDGQEEAGDRAAPAQALDRVPEEERQGDFEPHVTRPKQEEPIHQTKWQVGGLISYDHIFETLRGEPTLKQSFAGVGSM